ncbi:hypothetical protein K490DRAFT_46268, partial [Saccharata proteae CBS 121410]
LAKLSRPPTSPSQLQDAVGLALNPTTISSLNDDDTPTISRRILQDAKDRPENWLHQAEIPQNNWPAFIRLRQVAKKGSSTSAYPTLGLDTTVSQHRLSGADATFYPLQDEYVQVWYFFDGTLATAERLTELMDLEDAPVLRMLELRVARPGLGQGWIRRLWM